MKKLFLLLMAVSLGAAEAAPIRKVDAGIVQFKQSDQVTPSPPANYSNIFVKSDGKAYVSGSAGVSSMEQLHSGSENLSGSLFTGTLPVSKGGTGVATVSPSAILYGNGTDPVGLLAIGTSAQVLKGGVIPTFSTLAFSDFSGTIGVSQGGTGLTTVTPSGLVYGNGTDPLAIVAIGNGNQVLKGGAIPGYGSVALSTDVSGQLPIGSGGTGQSTQTSAFDALAPTTTAGDLIYYNGTDNIRLGLGTSGHVLTVSGSGPAWVSPSSSGGSSLTPGEHWVTGCSGKASTNTSVIYFTTVQRNAGACAPTYSASSTNGDTWTITCDGVYSVHSSVAYSGGAGRAGLTLNSTGLSTDIASLTQTQIIDVQNGNSNDDGVARKANATTRFVIGDVIRVQGTTTATCDTTTFNYLNQVRITRVGE